MLMHNLFCLCSFTIIHISNQLLIVAGQNYEVADIDCAVSNGRELLTARLRRPEGFRGVPVFADDAKHQSKSLNPFNLLPSMNKLDKSNEVTLDPPCQIFPDPTDSSGRVFVLRVADFTQCGVLKRNGFIHVRVWFPQLPGVVMLSDQEVIIMCKPPEAVVTQSKAAGFAGSIPSGARVSGIVEESPGRLEYEVALFRETTNSGGARSVPEYVTGINSQELAVDQAVPIGTRLQLRAKISPESAWQHAKLMEVSVSPDPKDPTKDGSVVLVKDGCRNPELATIIPKQPYRYKDRSNEVVLDFEAFLLSNMGEKNTLWLHTEIKACMEVGDCGPEFCLDVYQPSGFGKKRKRSLTAPNGFKNNSTSETFDYVNPLSQHWRTILEKHQQLTNNGNSNSDPIPTNEPIRKVVNKPVENAGKNTKFDENIGFSVMMPADYYRSMKIEHTHHECYNWVLSTMGSALFSSVLVAVVLILLCKLKSKGKKGFNESTAGSKISVPIPSNQRCISQPIVVEDGKNNSNNTKSVNNNTVRHHQQKHHHHHHHHSNQYARDASIYRP